MLHRGSAGGGEGDSCPLCSGLRSALCSSWHRSCCGFTEAQREYGFVRVVAVPWGGGSALGVVAVPWGVCRQLMLGRSSSCGSVCEPCFGVGSLMGIKTPQQH